MPDFVVVLVGGTSGLGAEAVRQLAKRGSFVIFAGRDAARGERLQRELADGAPRHAPVFVEADVSTQAGIAAMSRQIFDRTDRIDAIINNAGVMEPKRSTTTDGFEMNLAVHHLAPFGTTLALWPLLARSAVVPTVINTNSEGHRAALFGSGTVRIDFEDLQSTRSYDPFAAYSRSKLANLLFTYELDRRFGSLLRVNALHPGVVRTRLGRHFNPIAHAAAVAFGISPGEGAKPIVRLALDADAARFHGTYFDRFEPVRSSAASYDRDVARRLWETTEGLLGVEFILDAPLAPQREA